MNKIFSILAVVCLCAAVKAVEYDVTFDKKTPAAFSCDGSSLFIIKTHHPRDR